MWYALLWCVYGAQYRSVFIKLHDKRTVFRGYDSTFTFCISILPAFSAQLLVEKEYFYFLFYPGRDHYFRWGGTSCCIHMSDGPVTFAALDGTETFAWRVVYKGSL